MIDERELIARLEAADPETLARMLQQPTVEEETAYRAYLGDDRYARMHSLALQRGATRSAVAPSGNVVVIHGIMGGELTAYRGGGRGDHIWARIVRLALGRIGVLRLDSSGRREHHAAYEVRATGIMKRFYGELALSLARSWRVETFWFDWRKDLHLAAAELEASLNRWFGRDEPIHIVAHSMGGLVARTMIRNYPDRWASMWDSAGGGRRGGRLIMLGTPNQGSFAVPQILTGLEGMVRKLAMLDLQHRPSALQGIVNSFPGSYQMMPSPLAYGAGAARDAVEALYRAETYPGLPVSQLHLDAAIRFHAQLHDLHQRMADRRVDGRRELGELRRMLYVAGYDQPTLAAVEPARVADRRAYEVTLDGDGRVPHELGLLADVPTWYIAEDHGALSTNARIMDALPDLLSTGDTDRLPTRMPRTRARLNPEEARLRMEEREREEEVLLELYLRQTRRALGVQRTRARGEAQAEEPFPRPQEVAPVPAVYVSPGERMAEEMVLRGFLTAPDSPTARRERETPVFEAPRLEVRVLCAGIEGTEWLADAEHPVGAIAVGHYQGVPPAFAELALDRAISPALAADGVDPADAPLVLSQLAERGTIRGDLAQPFILPDPRRIDGPVDPTRVLVIAGMGAPGRFGVPELTVLARELGWAMGRIGKRNLATVLIGAGVQNLSVEEAVSAWLRGLKYALTGAQERSPDHLRRLTLVEHDPQRVLEIDDAVRHHANAYAQSGRMAIEYTPLDDAERSQLRERAMARRAERLRREAEALERGTAARDAGWDASVPATRVSIGLEGRTYRFGAMTAEAAVPEREVGLDPLLVREANDELLGAWDLVRQREHGRFLETLLVPQDLRRALSSSAPLVLMLDAATARIHWEMVAQPDALADAARAARGEPELFDQAYFLGTSRGLTRQLRTTLAPPPEPPPPPRRVLRVLIVADPAEDARLPGAEEEGIAVADLFESFNDLAPEGDQNRVEVVRLFGPREATRTNVLRHLTLRSYDVLHYAGHCFYDAEDPAASGWLFSGGRVVSARELDRIDRVPGFVFSNACESGITPDRSELRSAALAPSFAEAFFKRGVSNFVCTAWPVDDGAARTFALELYRRLLGIDVSVEDGLARFHRGRTGLVVMHAAMREARLSIAESPVGVRSWGAYQHYGDPNFRLFAEIPTAPTADKRRGAAPGSRRADGLSRIAAIPIPHTALDGGEPAVVAAGAAKKAAGKRKKPRAR
jgi:hypothetical protein